jgi:hypothetical protein
MIKQLQKGDLLNLLNTGVEKYMILRKASICQTLRPFVPYKNDGK